MAAVGLLLWFCVPTISSLHRLWLGYNYSHGYIVLGLAALLLIRELRRAPLEPLDPSWAGLAFFVAAVALAVLGHGSTTMLVLHAIAPALLASFVWALCGTKNARRLAPSLAYLYFAIPVWDLVTPALQHLTVSVVSAWIRVAGVPAYIEGNFIHLPSGSFEVEGGCAGLRYAMVALALAAFTNLWHRRPPASSMLMVSAALLLALFSNWLRVFTIVVAGYLTDMQHFLIARDHDDFGWLLFVFVCAAPLVWLNRTLQPGRQGSPTPTAAADSAMPLGRGKPIVAFAACAFLGLGIWLNDRFSAEDASPVGVLALRAPEVAGWQRIGDWDDVRRPLFAGPRAETAVWYADDDARIGAYMAHYASQRQEAELVYSGNKPEGERGRILADRPIALTVASGSQLPFVELEVADPGGERRLVWVGLRVAGETASSRLAAKALQLAAGLHGRHDAEAIVLTATCSPDCARARSALSRFSEAAAELLYEHAARPLPSP